MGYSLLILCVYFSYLCVIPFNLFEPPVYWYHSFMEPPNILGHSSILTTFIYTFRMGFFCLTFVFFIYTNRWVKYHYTSGQGAKGSFFCTDINRSQRSRSQLWNQHASLHPNLWLPHTTTASTHHMPQLQQKLFSQYCMHIQTIPIKISISLLKTQMTSFRYICLWS